MLSNGTRATAFCDITYDNVSHIVTLDVVNDSPVVPGVPNPILTQLAINLPQGAITSVGALTQSSASGATPGFTLKIDPALSPQLPMECFGNFGLQLTADPNNGAIANAAASVFAVASPAFGPVRFSFQLMGPGVEFLTARTLAVGFSKVARSRSVNAAVVFEAGGLGGIGRGAISGTDNEGLTGSRLPAIWLAAPPNASKPNEPNPIPVCASAQAGSHGCLMFSLSPGPTPFGQFLVPIGIPEVTIPIAAFPPSGTVCIPGVAPEAMIGITVYATMAVPTQTGPSPEPAPNIVEFAPRFDMKIRPVL